MAMDIARANRCLESVVYVHALDACPSDARFDVVLAHTPPGCPIHGESLIDLFADAAAEKMTRLANGIPRRETLRLAVVSAEAQYAKHVMPWASDTWDLTAARTAAVNTWSVSDAATSRLIDFGEVASVDYRASRGRTLRIEAEATTPLAATAHGIALWSVVDLADGIVLNASGLPRHAFFPWPQSVDLAKGDRLEVVLERTGRRGEVWSWRARVFQNGIGSATLTFAQSTFLGDLDVPAAIARVRGQGTEILGSVADGLDHG